MGKRGGRPTKLTDEAQERIIQALRAGNFREVAARYAGVSGAAFREWFQRGKADSRRNRASRHHAFYTAVRKAEADAEVLVVGRLMAAASHDVKAMAFWLERKHSVRWGRPAPKQEIELTGKDGGPVKVTKEVTEAEVLALWKAHEKS